MMKGEYESGSPEMEGYLDGLSEVTVNGQGPDQEVALVRVEPAIPIFPVRRLAACRYATTDTPLTPASGLFGIELQEGQMRVAAEAKDEWESVDLTLERYSSKAEAESLSIPLI